MGSWIYQNKEFTSEDIQDYVGFVYIITNMSNLKSYVGQKKFWSSKTIQRKKKKKRLKVESNWPEYFGSSSALQKDLEELGAYKFEREILHLCKSKSWMNYLELKEQIQRDVLLSETYYNEYLGGRINRKHLK